MWAISNTFGVTVQSIISANRLEDIPYLIPGQALVLPTTEFAYTVRPGDTVWLISRRFGVPVSSILALNRLTDPNAIVPGMVLRIPERTNYLGTIDVNTYAEPVSPERDTAVVNEVGPYLTYISPFSYQINEDGSINPLNDDAILAAARGNNIAPMMVITNFRNGNFDSGLVHTILSDETVQQMLIGNILSVLQGKGYYALNIDFERIPPEDRQLYNNFLRRVVAALRPLNYLVSTALAPKYSDIQTGAWHGAHDYRAHGEIVDFVILMTYEWGWSGGPPMAVSPLNQVRRVLDYATSVIPPEKILMGMPLYGYNWRLPYVQGGPFAARVSPQQAVRLAAIYGAEILYDQQAQAPYFSYTDEAGVSHIVWFEDARSVEAKLLLVNEYRLRGVSYWVLGLEFPQNWLVLDNMYTINKVVV